MTYEYLDEVFEKETKDHDIYNLSDDYCEDDEITPAEAWFMVGYERARETEEEE